ncbi:hypothetical protein [Prochlorococcus sp. MIT 1341]|uniref:hypothetical protein n=1 Tax=Prochlorococcus sp. MIT 1341 TaxID=3096221 RepID=UPI002A764755|nr:hypothetical protein [Prochlorococcus sp. MIT 1341]
MKNFNKRKDRKLFKRDVFRRRKSSDIKPTWRILLEALLMLLSGSWLLLFLNTLPRNYDFAAIISKAAVDLLNGVIQILDALTLFGSIALIAGLVVLGLLLLIGSLWRLVRIISLLISRSKKARKLTNR